LEIISRGGIAVRIDEKLINLGYHFVTFDIEVPAQENDQKYISGF